MIDLDMLRWTLSRQGFDQWHLDEVFLKINGRVHYRAPPRHVSCCKQSRREFASANQVEGACDEAVQVIGPRAALPLSLRNY